MRDSQGSETPFGWAGNPAYRGPQQPADHIRYSRQSGFLGITPQDREQWLRKYPHIDDFELAVKEGHEWVSRYWDKARRAEERPREFLDWWLAGEWMPLNPSGYKEPERIYNPEQLSEFIEQYFQAGGLIERLTRGRRDGLSDSLATKHYDKALGHAVKLRSVVPEFPKTPDTTGRPQVDLRRLQEWRVQCEEVAESLYEKVARTDVDRLLTLLRELDDHVKSGFPRADTAALKNVYERVRGEIERLLKVIGELEEPSKTFCIMPADNLEAKAKHWFHCVNRDQEYQPLLEKMREHAIPVPDDKAELMDLLSAAQWMAMTDWDKVREITEKKESSPAAEIPIDELSERIRVLGPAQTAEEKMCLFAWTRYRQEDPAYDKAFQEAQGRMITLYNGAVEVINRQRDLGKIAYLRNNKLESAFQHLYDVLFGTSSDKRTPDEPLREAVEELEAIRESIKVVVIAPAAPTHMEASMPADSAVAIPTIEEISEVIEKLIGLKREIEGSRTKAERGDDPESVKEGLRKAVESIRRLLTDPTATSQSDDGDRTAEPPPLPGLASIRDLDALGLPEDSQMRKLLTFSLGTVQELAHMQAVSKAILPTLKSLPLSALNELRRTTIPALVAEVREQGIDVSATLKCLGGLVEILEASNRYDSQKVALTAAAEAFRRIDLVLCPYTAFLRKELGHQPVVTTDIASIDGLIHGFERVKRRLEVARAECRERQEQPKRPTTKRRVKASQSAVFRKFRPWSKPGDACFIIEGNRILFHHDGRTEDLHLKSHSSTQDLLIGLQGGTLQSQDIKTRFCKGTTKPIQVVSRANERLNASIRKVGFTCLPEHDVEFIRYVRAFDHYESALHIHPSKAHFESAQDEDEEA